MRLTLSSTLFPLWNDHTDPISLFRRHLADTYMWKPRDDGHSKIDINISLYGSSIQNLISDSYSAELTTESQKEVQQLTEMYVKAVAEVFGKGSPGSTQMKG